MQKQHLKYDAKEGDRRLKRRKEEGPRGRATPGGVNVPCLNNSGKASVQYALGNIHVRRAGGALGQKHVTLT